MPLPLSHSVSINPKNFLYYLRCANGKSIFIDAADAEIRFIQNEKGNTSGAMMLDGFLTGLVLLAISLFLCASQIGEVNRNRDQLSDVHQIVAYLPQKQVLGIHSNMYEQWALHAYLHRYGFHSLQTEAAQDRNCFLVFKHSREDLEPAHRKLKLPLKLYDLYELADD